MPYERTVLEEPEDLDGGPLTREAILDAAREEAARKVREAYAEGLRRGIEAGKAEFDKSAAKCIDAAREAARAATEAHARFLAGVEPQVVELAHRIGSCILLREARTDRAMIGRTVRKAIEMLLERERLLVRIHPLDLEAMRLLKPELLAEFDGIRRLEFQPDETIAPGGCFVESELACADARLDTQLDALLEAIRTAPEPADPPEH